jgi:hypothetical protein
VTLAAVTNGDYTIPITESACSSLTVRIARVLSWQRTQQGHALACALGWHDHNPPRCDAQGYADILYVPQEEWR